MQFFIKSVKCDKIFLIGGFMSNKSWKHAYAKKNDLQYPEKKSKKNRIMTNGRGEIPDYNYQNLGFLGLIRDNKQLFEVYRAKNIQENRAEYIILGFTDLPEERSIEKIDMSGFSGIEDDSIHVTYGNIGIIHSFECPHIQTLVTIIDQAVFAYLEDESLPVVERIAAIKKAYVGEAKQLKR